MGKKFEKFWWFHFRNPVVRQGESGGFKWTFRRLTLDIETLSGNFKCRFTADEYPYGYLAAGEDVQTRGFAERLYMVAKLICTDQKLVNDLDRALVNYDKRLQKEHPVAENETEEKIALEEVKQVQEVVEKSPKERKKYERDVNGRFKAAEKKAEKLAE